MGGLKEKMFEVENGSEPTVTGDIFSNSLCECNKIVSTFWSFSRS